MSAFPPNIQPFADGLAAHGFRLSRGTYHVDDHFTLPEWVIDRPADPEWIGVFGIVSDCTDEEAITFLIAEAFAKWEAST
jgi:hypothetical protein